MRLPLLLLVCVFASGASSFALARPAGAVRLFSVDLTSSARADDVLSPGPLAGPPTVEIPAASPVLDFPAAAGEEIDALTLCGPVSDSLEFSVDRLAGGLPATPLAGEATLGHAAGDVFLADLSQDSHSLAVSQHELGLLPTTPPGLPYSPPPALDELDALDSVQAGPCLLFSVPSSNGLMGASGADILISAGPPPSKVGIAYGHASLGLAASDDIDALHIELHLSPLFADVYFSLAPGSPTLAGGNAVCAAACSPGDIFHSPGANSTAVLFAPASALGIAATDNVDAISFLRPVRVPGLSAGALGATAALLAALGGQWARGSRSRAGTRASG